MSCPAAAIPPAPPAPPRDPPLPADLHDGAEVRHVAFRRGLRPDPVLTLSEWADEHRYLSQKGSSEPGRWRTARTPYLREIMDCLSSDSPVEEVVLMKGTQVGGTEVGNNWLGYIISHNPGSVMMVLPTSVAAKRASKQRIAPMIEECPALRSRVKDPRSRDSGNTTLMKEFDGGVLVIAGANSSTELRSMPVRDLFADEVDAYPDDVDGEGDPLSLTERRQTNFPRRKRFIPSSPTVKGFSRIERRFEASDQRYYHVPCPCCGHAQRLVWGQVRWETRRLLEYACTACGAVSDAGGVEHGPHECPECHAAGEASERTLLDRDTGEVADVWYECEACQGRIDEHHKTPMLEAGRWIAYKPGPRRPAGFHLSALYSPLGWYSWREAVEDYLEAQDHPERLKVWTNTVLGETYADKGEQPDHLVLRQRAGGYRLRTVPAGGLLLTASVDVQDNRLEAKVKAWGRAEESWLVDWQQIHGDPAQDEVWDALDDILATAYTHESGAPLKISAAAVDTGGHHTHRVYEYCRHRSRGLPAKGIIAHVLACKGQSRAGKPILGKPTEVDVSWRGKTIRGGCKLWPIGPDTAKALVYARLRAEEGKPGSMHWPTGLPDEYFQQLTAEKVITKYIHGHPRKEWHLEKGRRNEALDCEVLAYAAALYLGVTRINWDRLEEQVAPRVPDLFTAAAAGAAAGAPAPNNAPSAPPSSAAPDPPRTPAGRSGWLQGRSNWLRK